MLLCAMAALAAPTLLRASVDGIVQGVGFSPYFPFVLISAVSLDWRMAALVALGAATLGDFLFVGSDYGLLETPSDIFGVAVFSIAAAMTIGLARACRSAVAEPIPPEGSAERPQGVIFSSAGGKAFVSWCGGKSFVPLGPEDDVATMMQDFLAQQELGRRLTRPDRQSREGDGCGPGGAEGGAA